MFSLLFLAKPTVLLQIDVFCGSRAEVVLRPIFVTWLCRACTRSRGLISLKFSRPGTVCTLFCGSRADVVLRQYLFPDSVARVRTRGLNFITPWSCLQFVGNCGSRAEVFSWQFFLPDVLFSYGDWFVLIYCSMVLLIRFVAPGQKLFCGNLVSWLCRAFFFSVGIKAGGFEFGCVGCCLPVGECDVSESIIRTLAARFLHHLA